MSSDPTFLLDAQSRSPPPVTTGQALLRSLREDRVLRRAFVLCGLLISYQLVVTILQPPWIAPVTNWLRAALAWPQLLVVAWATLRITQAHWPGARSWWMMTLALLSYAVARTGWTVAGAFIYPHGVPFPSWPDLFFVLQYPCFLAAAFLLPVVRPWLPRVRIVVDAFLWMSAVTALSWYFVLRNLYVMPTESELGRLISMGYQVGDLVLFYSLVVALTQLGHSLRGRATLSILCAAFACLFIADTWAAVLLLQPSHVYHTGSPPDLFWYTFYLLVPLASLVNLRLAPAEVIPSRAAWLPSPTWRDLLASFQFALPSMAVAGASIVILLHATLTSPYTTSLLLPEGVVVILLLLATIRPAVLFLEQQQVRRERETARAQEAALRLANQRMEEFLGVVSHELKTPLTSLRISVELMGRRLDALAQSSATLQDYARAMGQMRTLVARSEYGLRRIRRLVEDLLDDTRIRQGRLELRLEPCDLATVARQAVEDATLLNPTRRVRWVAEAQPVPVIADAGRIEQVILNFVSNAFKFSREDQPVEVRLQTEAEKTARVSVRDEGIGIPVAEQAHVWERFHQVQGTAVQSGSRIGLGIGLSISKTIVEQHHGQVGVESVPNHGATFWFTLPLAPALADDLRPSCASSSPPSPPPPSGQESETDP